MMRSYISIGIATLGYQYYFNGLDPETLIISDGLDIEINENILDISIGCDGLDIEIFQEGLEIEVDECEN